MQSATTAKPFAYVCVCHLQALLSFRHFSAERRADGVCEWVCVWGCVLLTWVCFSLRNHWIVVLSNALAAELIRLQAFWCACACVCVSVSVFVCVFIADRWRVLYAALHFVPLIKMRISARKKNAQHKQLFYLFFLLLLLVFKPRLIRPPARLTSDAFSSTFIK